MNWDRWVRPFHRWVSAAFTLAVLANVAAALGGGEPAPWLYLMPLLPLALLLLSGLYLFALPYALRRRGGRRGALK